eukprot:TRINITY_DN2000_c0_g1_i1.p1 TRINITY_DN2000_c0_g1~~TRINITY_DN2000_c0_g1_i1.p1  ORF type:complete len:408 (-),score=186.56 TRINITY_DN2000_c0_g1_i1:162-1385(-)
MSDIRAFLDAQKKKVAAPQKEFRVTEDEQKEEKEQEKHRDDEDDENRLVQLGKNKIKDFKETENARNKKAATFEQTWGESEVALQAAPVEEIKEKPKKTFNIHDIAGGKKAKAVHVGPDLDQELFPEVGANVAPKKEQPRPRPSQPTQPVARAPEDEFGARPSFTGVRRVQPSDSSPQTQAAAPQRPAAINQEFENRPLFKGTKKPKDSSPLEAVQSPVPAQETNTIDFNERPQIRSTKKREENGSPQKQEPKVVVDHVEEKKAEEVFADGPIKFHSKKQGGGVKQLVLTEAQKKELEMDARIEEERKKQLQEIEERRKHREAKAAEPTVRAEGKTAEGHHPTREDRPPREANGEGRPHKGPKKTEATAPRKNSKPEEEEKKEDIPNNAGKYKEFKQSTVATMQGWD